MRRFQNDNLHLQLLPRPNYDILSPVNFDTSIAPGPKSVISCLSPELLQSLLKLYSKLYPIHSEVIDKGEIFLPSTFRQLPAHGQQKGCYILLAPPFPFSSDSASQFKNYERLAKIEYFMLHTGASEPSSNLFVSVSWPMVHPNRNYYGKPVEVWCCSIFEPNIKNKFCLASSINSRAIVSFEKMHNESVCVSIPIIE